MAEYIEREGLLENLEEQLSDLRFIVKYEKRHGSVSDEEKAKAKLEKMNEVICLVKSVPTADVQKVRYGKWMYEDSDLGWADYKCSECGIIIHTDVQDEDLYDFCPYCGAKMDKE